MNGVADGVGTGSGSGTGVGVAVGDGAGVTLGDGVGKGLDVGVGFSCADKFNDRSETARSELMEVPTSKNVAMVSSITTSS